MLCQWRTVCKWNMQIACSWKYGNIGRARSLRLGSLVVIASSSQILMRVMLNGSVPKQKN